MTDPIPTRWDGVDYSSVVLGKASSVQDYTLFTYDDFQWGQLGAITVSEPNHIVAIINKQFKLAKYYNPVDTYALNRVSAQEEYEFYDMLADPMEMINLANATNNRTAEQVKQFQEMKLKLVAAEKARLKTLMLSWDVDLVGNAYLRCTFKFLCQQHLCQKLYLEDRSHHTLSAEEESRAISSEVSLVSRPAMAPLPSPMASLIRPRRTSLCTPPLVP